ncbi:nuclease-related domain-containing protein [Streptomyces qinglanensis]|uniref:nuclease-related domain-containing protein n=1 Tax=Streptomyces qinglanensis TaxID=943816 RepID=UPI003D70E2E6
MNTDRRRNKPGASAARMARQRRASLTKRILTTLPPTLLTAAAIGYLITQALGIEAGVAAVCVTLLLGIHQVITGRPSSWSTGAAGERRTARILAPLTWTRRYAALHDRAIPRSRANLDHLVIGRAGPVYVDSKNWTSPGSHAILGPDKQLYYETRSRGGRRNRYPQARAVATVRWEADQAQRVLGWPVRAVIAVHGAHVPGSGLSLDGVTVIQARKLRRYLRRLPAAPGWNTEMVRETARIADRRLPPATGPAAPRPTRRPGTRRPTR